MTIQTRTINQDLYVSVTDMTKALRDRAEEFHSQACCTIDSEHQLAYEYAAHVLNKCADDLTLGALAHDL